MMMKQLGQDPSDAELKELIRSVDENGGACDPSIATREAVEAQKPSRAQQPLIAWVRPLLAL